MPTDLTRRSFLAAGAAAVAAPTLTAQPAGPRFKLGLVTYNVAATWDLATVLRVCREVGIAAVECRTTHRHGVEPTLAADARRDVRRQFADSGVAFWGCGSICEFHSADAAVVRRNVEDCKKFVDLVKDLGGRGVKVRPNGIPPGGDPARTFEQIGRALAECGRAAADAGVEIWVEVHGAVTAVPRNMKSIMDACGHASVGVTWNSNPTDLDEQKGIGAGFELLRPWVKSCHINDLENDRRGTYPYRDLFRRLTAMNYDRYTLIEVGRTYEVAAGTEFLKGYKKLWDELTRP
ncbi:MAG TPA: TIM barrel protein [Urbifossiella sp.]|nr:TIM barrel protein [Urbifossiella sp.]